MPVPSDAACPSTARSWHSNSSRALPVGAGGEAPTLVKELTPAPEAAEVLDRLADLPGLLFLDSALRHPTLGRFSFLMADPFDWLSSRGKEVFLASTGRSWTADPFAVLAERLGLFPQSKIEGLPPFQGGVAGLFGYDLAHHLERLPRPKYDEFRLPDMALGFYDWVLAFDHTQKRAWCISTGWPETDFRLRQQRAESRWALIRSRLAGSARTARKPHGRAIRDLAPQWPVPEISGLTSNFSRPAYLDAVRRAVAYVHAGDCFQVNLAQRLLFPAPADPLGLYHRLRTVNAATFAGYFDAGSCLVLSASPERFLQVQHGDVETRPIKGTRPRADDPAIDLRRREELLSSAKDRSENIMIVDLLRNDLGRVCQYGSVRVPSLCRLESYATVHHLVSEVRGRLRPGLGPVDLLRAAFPGGSVTGAPKIRAMEIIAELEPTVRGPYCGSLGFVGFDGTMDTNILIRTFTLAGGWLHFPVGGGIVADSQPEKEYAETWHKAEGLLRAIR